jgi:hypothetical protein
MKSSAMLSNWLSLKYSCYTCDSFILFNISLYPLDVIQLLLNLITETYLMVCRLSNNLYTTSSVIPLLDRSRIVILCYSAFLIIVSILCTIGCMLDLLNEGDTFSLCPFCLLMVDCLTTLELLELTELLDKNELLLMLMDLVDIGDLE